MKAQVTVASIFPAALKTTRNYCPVSRTTGYLMHYELPAAPRDGDPVTLVVECAYQREYFLDGQYTKYFVEAEHIGRCIKNTWAGGVDAEGGGPGVWVCEGDMPTVEETQRARESQQRFFEYMFNKGQGLYQRGKTNEIPDLCKKATLWLDPRSKDTVPWVRTLDKQALKDCPACASKIPDVPGSFICPVCRQQIAARPEHLNFDRTAGVLVPKPASAQKVA